MSTAADSRRVDVSWLQRCQPRRRRSLPLRPATINHSPPISLQLNWIRFARHKNKIYVYTSHSKKDTTKPLEKKPHKLLERFLKHAVQSIFIVGLQIVFLCL